MKLKERKKEITNNKKKKKKCSTLSGKLKTKEKRHNGCKKGKRLKRKLEKR